MTEPLRNSEEVATPLWERLEPGPAEWLRDRLADVGERPESIRSVFPAVGREIGRGPLDPDTDADDVHAWTVDDAGRTLLLAALGERALSELPDLYRFGDAAERRGLLRALPYLPIGDSALGLVDDAIRTNDTGLIAAGLGPYATAHLDDAGYSQAVLKCVFCDIPITPLDGVPERVTPDGARMLAAFVHERIAAGRDVPSEVWTVIDRYPPAAELEAIEAELDSEVDERRRAAIRTLEARSATAADGEALNETPQARSEH